MCRAGGPSGQVWEALLEIILCLKFFCSFLFLFFVLKFLFTKVFLC